MADVQPLKALHYNLEKTGGLQDGRLAAVRRDRRRERQRLESQSPYNVVEIDLPVRTDGERSVYARAPHC
jgi:hypothetical protein